MALIGNHSVLTKTCAFFTNGTATAGAYAANTRTNFFAPARFSSRRFSVAARSSFPEGYALGEAYLSAWKAGGAATQREEMLLSTAAAALAAGRNLESAGTLTLTTLDATASLVIFMEGDGTLTITGTGTLAGAAALAASGSLTLAGSAAIGAIASKGATATLSLSGSAGMTALGFMEIDPNASETMTEATIVNALLTALLTDYADTGNVAQGIQDAGSAGNPWAALLADNNDSGTFGERMQKLLTVAKFLGLK